MFVEESQTIVSGIAATHRMMASLSGTKGDTVQQFEVPIKVPVDPDANTTDLLVDRVAKTPDSALFSIPTGDGQWEDITAREFHR